MDSQLQIHSFHLEHKKHNDRKGEKYPPSTYNNAPNNGPKLLRPEKVTQLKVKHKQSLKTPKCFVNLIIIIQPKAMRKILNRENGINGLKPCFLHLSNTFIKAYMSNFLDIVRLPLM